MKLKLSSFSKEKQIVRSNLSLESLGLDENGLTDPVKVEVITDKNNSCLTVECKIEVNTKYDCDRCLEPFDSVLHTSISFIITSDSHMKADTDEVIFVTSGDDEVDITKKIRDAILLAVPYKKVCSPDCQGLCSSCGKNLNEGPCDCKDQNIDPRWEKLKKLKKMED